MTREAWLNALCYEAMLWALGKWPFLALQPWTKLLMLHCRPDWTQWKTKIVMEQVDQQAAKLVEKWEKEERETKAQQLADEAQKLFPAAKITALPNAVVPSVMIEQAPPEGASDAVKALGESYALLTHSHFLTPIRTPQTRQFPPNQSCPKLLHWWGYLL